MKYTSGGILGNHLRGGECSTINCTELSEHSFFRRGGGPEEFRGGSLTFCLPKKGGSV